VFKCNHYALTVTAKFEHTIPGLVFHRKPFTAAMPVANHHCWDNNLRPQLSHAESIVCLLYQLLTRPVLHTSQVLVFKCERYALTATVNFEHTIPGLVFHRKLVPLSVWHGQQLALQPSGAL
jgi:hypothetical protein